MVQGNGTGWTMDKLADSNINPWDVVVNGSRVR